jgi:hypothetical protein
MIAPFSRHREVARYETPTPTNSDVKKTLANVLLTPLNNRNIVQSEKVREDLPKNAACDPGTE